MSGVEIKNSQSTFQVTNETRVTAFLRKGSVTGYRKDDGEFDEDYIAYISYNPLTEVLAVSSTSYISFLNTEDGSMKIGSPFSNEIPSPAPVIYYWVFGKATTLSTSGMQVFDGQGTSSSNLLYDSSWIPIKPLTILNTGSTNLGSGSYAAIPLNVRSKVYREVREIENTGSSFDEIEVLYYRQDDAISINNGSINILEQEVEQFFKLYQLNWSSSYAYHYDNSNNATTQYLIIDVAGL